MMKAFSAGGSDAISSAVAIHCGVERAEQHQHRERKQRMQQQLDRDDAGHLPRHAIERTQRHRDAEREQRDRRRGVLQECQRAIERDRRLEMKGRGQRAEPGGDDQRMEHDLPRDIERSSAAAGAASLSNSAISSGTIENRKMLSKQKISATGTAAGGPNVASARPGPI